MSTDAPEDERAALGFLPPRRENVPLVLQASPLDAKSSGGDEFFYDPFADLEFGDFAAARAFVIRHGHVVVFHECPNTMAFQAMFPMATIGYILALPPGLLAKGHETLASQCDFHRASAQASPPPARPPRSLLDQYVAAGFATSHGGAPSPSTTTISSSSRLGFLLWFRVGGDASRLQSSLPLNAAASFPPSIPHLGRGGTSKTTQHNFMS
jgi:hypothetical protein